MTYYQELGVDSRASAEEIRRAYRHQIKVFHPDLQTNEKIRATAEAKVRRLNEIVQVLTDPEQRRAYDHELLLLYRSRPQEDLRGIGDSGKQLRLAGLAAGALAAGGLFWVLRGPDPAFNQETAPMESKLRRIPAVLAEPVAARPARSGEASGTARGATRRDQTEPRVQSPAVASAAVRPSKEAPAPPQIVPPPAQAPSPPPVAAKPVAESPAPAPPAAPANPLEGTWLYQPAPAGAEPNKLYPPKYIELKIQSGPGTLFGRYRSTYEVHDQALSPSVNFNFQSAANGSQTKAAWLGPGGSRGIVELKLLNPMNLQVDWKTEQTAPGLDLISGTAILVKRLEN